MTVVDYIWEGRLIMLKKQKSNTAYGVIIAAVLIGVFLILGTVWMGRSARKDTDRAVRSVSLLYLDELAGRREQVVGGNLQNKIRDMQVAVSLMDENDLKDIESMRAYQLRMRQLYNAEKFAFVSSDGRIYTATGIQENIEDYSFDYQNLSGPEISIYNIESPEKKVVIVSPVDIPFGDVSFVASFMEIDMQEMLSGVSMDNNEEATFCNIYTNEGVALTNTVLGGLAMEDNLLEAMRRAEMEKPYSYERFCEEFKSDERGVVSFKYDGILETLSYVPIKGTNWLLTYLIRESVISDRINSISRGIIVRSIIQSLLTVIAMAAMFWFIIVQTRRNSRLLLEKEKTDTETRIKQEEMEQRIALQERLLEEEKKRTQQDNMITAMASDYRSVYYVDLDHDDAVCYRGDPENEDQHSEGVHFPYYDAFALYGKQHVTEAYREGFLKFIDPENIRESLKQERILAYRYLAQRDGKEYYEMIRAASVSSSGKDEETEVHAVGIGMTVIDEEMRQTMAQQQALSDALAAAEQASKAKTAFLSSMSHEIRTPMNAIIGLDNIALNDPETPEKTRDYLEKIGASADHLLNLINDILDMSRIESGRMTLRNEEFSFRKLLEAVNTMFSSQCQEKGLEYQCRINSEVDDYYIGDSMKLRQVLINILGNAVKFTPEGGKVELQVERKARYEGKTTLAFAISDTGIGISEEFMPRLFDSFAQEDASNTSKYGSSGLGLAITKNIVEMMNGSISVKSVKGEGSTFTITVTLDASSRKENENDSFEQMINPEKLAFLIVDDDPIACEHAKLVLEKAGIAAETAVSGARAVEMVKLRHARQEPFDLILVDWQMPEMDGVETARQIRSATGDESAIIILTAYRWDDVLEEALLAGVDSFMAKPLFAGAVMEEYQSALQRKKQIIAQKQQKAQLNGRRILLAEDVQINAEIMLMVLQSREMETEHAVNGKIAVDMFASHPEGYYDAILMDLRMPEMDGLEATRQIRAMEREDAKDIPIIALTANAFDEDVQRSLQAGMNAHLSKPVQPDTLYQTLENLIK